MIDNSIDQKKDGIWQKTELNEDKILAWKVGPLRLWCKCVGDEIWIGYDHKGNNSTESNDLSNIPENLKWARWVIKERPKFAKLTPMFPDRPIVIKPEVSFRVAKGGSSKVYVRVPLWAKLEFPATAKAPHIEIPTVILSRTYFGTPVEGEHCYWITSSVRRDVVIDPARCHLAICPMQVFNDSNDDLFAEKICLRVGNLSLFLQDEQLWGNETRITYKGLNNISNINVTEKAPQEIKEGVLVNSARSTESKKGLVARTFATLKNLSGVGFLIK